MAIFDGYSSSDILCSFAFLFIQLDGGYKKVLLIKQFNILYLYSTFHPKSLNILCLYSFINHIKNWPFLHQD